MYALKFFYALFGWILIFCSIGIFANSVDDRDIVNILASLFYTIVASLYWVYCIDYVSNNNE